MPGIGITLPIRLGNTGMFAQSQTVVEQTKSNFVNLILTKKGERLPPSENLGCDLWNILFEPLTQATAEKELPKTILHFKQLIKITRS